jgi:hypothetical protein
MNPCGGCHDALATCISCKAGGVAWDSLVTCSVGRTSRVGHASAFLSNSC